RRSSMPEICLGISIFWESLVCGVNSGGGAAASGGVGRTGDDSLVRRVAPDLPEAAPGDERALWRIRSSAFLSRRRSSERGSSPRLFTISASLMLIAYAPVILTEKPLVRKSRRIPPVAACQPLR